MVKPAQVLGLCSILALTSCESTPTTAPADSTVEAPKSAYGELDASRIDGGYLTEPDGTKVWCWGSYRAGTDTYNSLSCDYDHPGAGQE